MMSEFPAMPTPPPRQNPWTAAITGISHSYMAANAAKQPRLAPISASSPLAWICLMSTPAHNPRLSAPDITPPLSDTLPIVGPSPARHHRVGQGEPPSHVECVDRRVINDHFGNAGLLLIGLNGHGKLRVGRSSGQTWGPGVVHTEDGQRLSPNVI